MDDGMSRGNPELSELAPTPVANRLALAVFWLALAIYVFVLPVGGTIAVRNLAMVLMSAATLLAVFRAGVAAVFPLRAPWLAYMGVALLSLLYAVDIPYSLAEIKTEIGYPALIFFMAATMIRDRNDWRRLALLILAGNIVLAAFNIGTALTGGTTKDGLVGSLNSGVGTYSTYVVTVLPVIAALGWSEWQRGKRALPCLIALTMAANGVALYFTANRQSFVALEGELLVIVAWALKRRLTWRRTAVASATVIVSLALITFQFAHRGANTALAPLVGPAQLVGHEARNDVRWPVWQYVAMDVVQHPIVGSGFGIKTYETRFRGTIAAEGVFSHAHNMLLNRAVQIGVPGVLAFLWLFWMLPWRVRLGLGGDGTARAIALAGIALAVGVFLKNMTDDFFTRDGALLYWLLGGAILGGLRPYWRIQKP